QGSVGSAPVSPNTGQLFTVGKLNVDTTALVGLDIAPVTNAAFASLTSQGANASQLYTINLATGAATLVGTIGGGRLIRDIAFAVRAENVFAVTSGNRLLSFNSGAPGVINRSRAITGLGSGENIVGIDFRPATGQLFALSNASRVYTINTGNGVATPVGAAPLNPALNGVSFGVDFNPVPDRIRVVSDADQNLRINPNSGAVVVDGALAFAAGDANAGQNPNVVGAAYTNSFQGATTTTLYGIDSSLHALVTQGSVGSAPVSPNNGQLFTVGSLGVDPNDIVGFDISSESGVALASFNMPGGAATQLHTINLTTGAAVLIGAIGGGEIIRDIAIEVRAPNVFAVTASDTLISFNAGTPGVINSSRIISGMASGETVAGIDFRPATGQLYALSSANRLYLINPITGNAAPVNIAPFNPALNGVNFGVDFNPVPDRIRVVSDAGQNLRLNPNNSAVVVDGALAFAAGDANAGQNPNVVGAAYTNSFQGATTTTLYGIVPGLNALVRQGSVGGSPVSPNTGQLFTVGSLGVATIGSAGFDVASPSNAAFASLTAPGANQSQFFAVNLATGAATLIGAIGVNEAVHSIAIGGVSRGSGFDVCLQDDRTGDSLQFDSCTGDYQFTRCGAGGFTLVGRGDTNRVGNFLTLRDSRVFAALDMGPIAPRNAGSAVVRLSIFGPFFLINDSGTANNTCSCR
ncbi:MAG: DUF4394 domain-containing protein, partial [Blastocatellia bacterium]